MQDLQTTFSNLMNTPTEDWRVISMRKVPSSITAILDEIQALKGELEGRKINREEGFIYLMSVVMTGIDLREHIDFLMREVQYKRDVRLNKKSTF